MMQVVLKSYGYYEGQIDGLFGNVSKKALILFQNQTTNLNQMELLGPQTCTLLLK